MRSPLLLFLLLAALYALASTGRAVRTSDETMTLFQTQSLVLDGTTAVPQAERAGLWYGVRDLRGRPRAPYGPGHAAAAAPFYALGHHALSRLPGVPPDAADLVVGFATSLSSAVFAAAAAALLLAAFRAIGIEDRPALAAALAAALGTPLLAYSAWFFSEPLASALLLGAALALARRREGLAGLLLGAALLVRPAHAIATPVFAAAVLARDGRAGLAAAVRLAAGAAGGLAVYLVHNLAIYGDPLEFGYPRAAEQGRRLNTFENPLGVGLAGFLLSPGKSIFLFAPPAIVALAGLRALFRRERALAVVAAGAPLVYLLFYAKYTQWEGGYCFGPRYLVPALALLALALGPALAEGSARLRRALAVLAVLGFLVQSIGLATSFLEDQAVRAPAPGAAPRSGYYDEELRYRLSHAPLASQGRLLLRYATSGEPAPLGKGFDRWFVFLSKGGVSPATLAAVAAAFAAAGTAAGAAIYRDLSRAPAPAQGNR